MISGTTAKLTATGAVAFERLTAAQVSPRCPDRKPRTLEQAKRSYEIAEVGVKLAERRVEEQNLLAELGRAKAQDQVDAQNALNTSKNQQTQALVTHTIARLQFWNNMGILYIKDNGQWEEINDGNSK